MDIRCLILAYGSTLFRQYPLPEEALSGTPIDPNCTYRKRPTGFDNYVLPFSLAINIIITA